MCKKVRKVGVGRFFFFLAYVHTLSNFSNVCLMSAVISVAAAGSSCCLWVLLSHSAALIMFMLLVKPLGS